MSTRCSCTNATRPTTLRASSSSHSFGVRFRKRVLVPIELDYPEAEKRAHELLSMYAKMRSSRAESVAEKFATEFVLKLLKKRLFSSPEAFKPEAMVNFTERLGSAARSSSAIDWATALRSIDRRRSSARPMRESLRRSSMRRSIW